jgi:hypothetical protein
MLIGVWQRHYSIVYSLCERNEEMTKQEALAIIKLLSALESWAFSTKNMLPDYLHDDLYVAVKKLENIVLEKNA